MTEYMMKTDKNGKPRYYKSVDGKMKVISRSEYEENGALEIKPGRTTSLATSVNKQCMVLLSDKVRLAKEQDFDDFHICFDGFRNNTMYCYNPGPEPI